MLLAVVLLGTLRSGAVSLLFCGSLPLLKTCNQWYSERHGGGVWANGAAVHDIHQVSALEMTIQSKHLLELNDNYEGHGNQGVDPGHASNLMSSSQASPNLHTRFMKY